MESFTFLIRKNSFISHSWSGSSKETWDVKDKYSGELLSQVTLASDIEVERAVASSKAAFDSFKKSSAGERHELLKALKDKLEQHHEAFSQLLSREAGKPIGYARGEISRCLATLEFAAEEARRIGGEVIPMDFAAATGKRAITSLFPIGPVIGISPFNFPLNLALHKIAPAIAAGCSIIIKPSPYAPLTLLAFASLMEEVGLPKGLVNIVCCSNQLSEKMVRDERFKAFSFTGSPTVGWMLKEKAGKKKVQLELGGDAAVIIDDSADLEKAAKQVAIGAYLYAGQICISTQRIYVQKSIEEKFEKLLIEEIKNLPCGDPQDEKTQVGPLIDPIHFERIKVLIHEAKDQGAKVLIGGNGDESKNLFYPTLLKDVSHQCRVCQEEAFGPVAVMASFEKFEDCLKEVNESRFGLQAGVFTNRLDHMRRSFEELEVGGLMINNIPGFRIDHMPYGGIKDSGLGREGLRYSIEEFSEPKLLVF